VGILNQAEILFGPRNFYLWNRPIWIISATDGFKGLRLLEECLTSGSAVDFNEERKKSVSCVNSALTAIAQRLEDLNSLPHVLDVRQKDA